MYSTDQIIAIASRYTGARGIELSTLGRHSVRSSNFFERLSSGRTTLRTISKFIQYASDHWPEGLAWPGDIPRPEPSPDSPATHPESVSRLPGYRFEPPQRDEREAALAAALALDAKDQIKNPNALCAALRVPRHTYDHAIRAYADGKPRAVQNPRRDGATAQMVDALMRSGDVRFAQRRERWERHAALARAMGF